MEIAEDVTQIFKRISGALVDESRFGRSENTVYRVKPEKLVEVARALREGAGLDWLENLSAMESEGQLVFTYFLRNTGSGATLILRSSAALYDRGSDRGSKGAGLGGESWVTMDGVSAVWPMAVLREREISRLFGVKFSGTSEAGFSEAARDIWDGFPLRKSFDVVGAAAGSALPGGVAP